jgi:outer membrane receptor protein involved in Fe transport
MIICLCALLILLLCAPCPSLQAEDEAPPYQMEDTVVTVPAFGEDTMDLPSSTTVITRTQIEQLPAREIDDVLKHAVGVHLWQPWGIFGPDSRPTLRGFSQSRATRFMKDGMLMNRVICGGAKTNEIPLEMVEEIIIGRGMNASVMGNSAMAGIINIEGKTPGEKTEAQVKGTYGTYGTWSVDGGVSARLTPKWGLLAGYHHFDTDGYRSWSDDWVASKIEDWGQLDVKGENTIANFREAIDDKQIRTTEAASGRLVYSPGGISGNTHLSLEASSWDNDVHNSMRFNDNYQDRFRTALTLKHKGKIDIHAGVSYLDEEFSFDRPFTPTPSSFNLADSRYYYRVKGQESRIPLKDYAASANLAVPLGKHQHLVVASHLRFGTIENEIHTHNQDTGEMRKSDLMEGKQITGEATLRDEITFDRLTLSLALQYQWMRVYDAFYEDTSILEEYDDRTDDQFNPKLGLVYRLSEATALRCSVARSSNSPSLMSMFGIFEQPPGRERIGNPLLETESAIGYEAGLEHRPSKHFMVGLTGFYNDLYDWMESTEARADLPDQDLKENAVLWQNVDRAMTAGVEVETSWMPGKGLKLFANYTYTCTRIDKFDENRIRYKYHTATTTHNKEKEGNQLAGQPRHGANAGLVYAIPRWVDISLTARYVGERYYDVENTVELDAYSTVDLKLSRSFGRHVKASLSVNNLFDEEWQDDEQHVPPGRMVFAGLKIGF